MRMHFLCYPCVYMNQNLNSSFILLYVLIFKYFYYYFYSIFYILIYILAIFKIKEKKSRYNFDHLLTKQRYLKKLH